ncbi:MAG: sigma-70 family RNA polymerase sigma factor [Cyanobacteriota bacterium]|nr:sigma-70 family RNA polymerase sigma factor [Cyanobacteriota bacterium]
MNSDSQKRDNALNQQLQQLVEEIKQYSANDDSAIIRAKRRIALNKFVNAVVNSKRLSKQTRWSGLANYEDYHNEALQLTLMEICGKIDEYNPKYPVMAWVNKIFHWRFLDVVNKERNKGITKIPKGEKISPVLSLDDINREINTENQISQQEIIKEVIYKDPEKYLASQHLRGHSNANLQAILILLLEGKKWKEISRDLGVPLTTASSFYQRRMHKIIDYLKKYI